MLDALHAPPFCTGAAQSNASLCDVRVHAPPGCCTTGIKFNQAQKALPAGQPRHCAAAVDLVARADAPKIALRRDRLLNSSLLASQLWTRRVGPRERVAAWGAHHARRSVSTARSQSWPQQRIGIA
jgi:hypothetical protein